MSPPQRVPSCVPNASAHAASCVASVILPVRAWPARDGIGSPCGVRLLRDRCAGSARMRADAARRSGTDEVYRDSRWRADAEGVPQAERGRG